ncbi:SDR family NAD(P)-dependent oxidoreductase [uncultured Nostoc sp.]|uniref:SDR family NAD(P)-dependent oxidoreductase n=1 Tax=uncultured Nostoc sp. TaxID=340711 RepID=UPI0035C99173
MNSSENLDNLTGSEIAIIGIACRFPGANNADDFWQNLRDGVHSISALNDETLQTAGVDQDLLKNPNYVKAEPILDDVESFDAGFFGYSPTEAEIMDPQQRLFLECAWEAFENAGYDPKTHKRSIGVFAGAKTSTYMFNLLSHQGNPQYSDPFQVGLGNDLSCLSTRVSYKLNLKGPSINVQTACSTSLVAVHLACQSLLLDECQMALAGGVAINVPHRTGYLYQPGSVESPDGYVRTFDAQAQGTVFGSGLGAIVLKRLEDAIADGDHIYAVIKGSAINNDGSLKASFTAPNVDGQTRVILEALANAQVKPESISYLEAHGTGTQIGDPIEIRALTKAFRTSTQTKQYCAIGSVKSNIGHLDAAAGISGLIKTALALKHQQIPPTLHFQQPNPKIDFANSPFYVNTELSEWSAKNTPRRAGVSSFGVGSTNVYIVMEEVPALEPSSDAKSWQVLLLSAKTASALETATANLADHLKQNPTLNLADVAYTLKVGRHPWQYRRMVLCRDIEDAISLLESPDPDRVFDDVPTTSDRPVAFMFTGQGAQYVQMARDLYQNVPIFRKEVDRCCTLLESHLQLDLRQVIYPTNSEAEQLAQQQLMQTFITQPALFVIEYALAKLWMAWGVKPEAMIGHSVGEYVAACLAGVFSLEDALTLVVTRGRLMQSVPSGAMLAVSLSRAEVLPLIGKELSLAVVNAPNQCVVAGAKEHLVELQTKLEYQGIKCRELHTSHAFHSLMMEPILDEFQAQVEKVMLQPPQLPYVSNVTGKWITVEEATNPRYWVQHLRQTVQFADGVQTLLQDSKRILLEIGPGNTLATFARQQIIAGEQVVLTSLRHPKEAMADLPFLLTTSGRLWLSGVSLDWGQMTAAETHYRVPLPTYPFERQRYWVDFQLQTQQQIQSEVVSLRKKPDISNWFYIPSWKQTMPPLPVALPELTQQRRWLLFVDECGVGELLAQRLQTGGQQVICVYAGNSFGKVATGHYTLNPMQQADYDSLLKELQTAAMLPQQIVHLWSITAPLTQNAEATQVAKQADRFFYELLFLAQALGQQNLGEKLQMAVVSNNLQNVTGLEVPCLEKAVVLGPCRVIPHEFSNINCRSIDIILPQLAHKEQLSNQILAELLQESAENVVAYRGNQRWVQTFETVPLADQGKAVSRLRQGGVYLITGGMGGIGLVLAEHLAKTVQARLVLTQRSVFPQAQDWENWLVTHDINDATSTKIQKLQALQALGAEVLVLRADVVNHEQMEKVRQQTYEQFGELHGVIHAAGIAGGGMIQLKTPEMANKVLSPKVTGTLVLGEVLQDAKLDFFVLCSSLQSIMGEFGQVDYCAANAFLDAFAQYYTAKYNVFTTAIDWDLWEDVGIKVNTAIPLWMQKLRQGAVGSEVAHPLLDRCVEESSEREVFLTNFSISKHWVLNEHKVIGYAILPGTAYLEIARAAFAKHAHNGIVEIRDTSFLQPLIVPENSNQEVYTILNKSAGDIFEFTVSSGDGQQQEHATGKIVCVAPEPPIKYNIPEIFNRCPHVREIVDTPEKHDVDNQQSMQFGPRWQSLKQVNLGKNEAVAMLELPQEYAGEVEKFTLHPALLDVAVTLAQEDGGADYFPFWYNRIRIKSSLPSKIYSYVKHKDNHDSSKETISFDVVIMDESGIELVQIEGFTLKKVTDLGVFDFPANSDDFQEDRQQLPEENVLGEGILSHEGVEVFTRVLSRNMLPQILVSTTDLQASIEQVALLMQSNIGEEIEKIQGTTKHPRPKLQTPYVAPRSELEKILAEIWQAVIGIEPMGIHDNFFELGGDSVLAIRIIAKANETGLQLSPPQLFQHQTIASLAEAIGSCVEPVPQATVVEAVSLTPQLDKQSLERLLASESNVEDVYPLTPMQQEMLIQSQRAQTAGLYFLQFDSTFRGEIDYKAFTQAWQHLVDRHAVLRTSFKWEGLAEKVQIVRAQMNLSWDRLDWRQLSPTQQQQQLEAFLKADRERGFDHTQAPLMRLALIQMADNVHQFVWSIHHILMDGWCFTLILQEVFALYEAFRQNQQLELESIRPYRNYIAWLQQQDLSKAEFFWQQTLQGFKSQNLLGTNRPASDWLQPLEEYGLQTLRLSAELTAALQSLARQSQITLNTLIEGAWGIFLNKFSGNNDVAFGISVSGRPTDLKGADSMIGLFTNLLPARMQISPDTAVLPWLKYFQTKQVELRQFEYSPLALVHQWSEVAENQPLFESILRFQNYPIDDSLGERLSSLKIEGFRATDFWSYPLCIAVTPGVEMFVEMTYDYRHFDADVITQILNYLQILLASLVANPNQRIIELPHWT